MKSTLLLLLPVLLSACASLTPTEPLPEAAPSATSATSATSAPAAPPPVAAPPAPVVVLTPEPVVLPEPPPAPPAPLLPRSRLDPAQDAERASLWDRIRAGYTMPDLEGELVQRWEQHYARQPDYVQRMVSRGGLYLFHIVEEVERRGMPAELALLPFIESAFNPQAMSRARASGMWQFMPGTGRDFELRQNLFRDDRRDVLASTRAALDYLQQLHAMFGDWHLALAAYNWGQGNVSRAIRLNQQAGRGTDYPNLRMPDETRNYVPKLQAVANIVLDPQRLGLTLPPLQNHPYFLSVAIERDIDVALAARLAGLPLDEFQMLNPQLNKPVILAAGTPQVLLPYDNANRFVRELHAWDKRGAALATWTAWTAPRTMKPAEAARLVGTSEATLRQANAIPARMLVKSGSTLLVPRSAKVVADVSERVADNAMMLLAPEARPARRGVNKGKVKGKAVAGQTRKVATSSGKASPKALPKAARKAAPRTRVAQAAPR